MATGVARHLPGTSPPLQCVASVHDAFTLPTWWSGVDRARRSRPPWSCMQPVAPKVVAWALTFLLSLLIVASHKHYTVDVTVAWYTVPLVFLALERRYSTKRKEGDDVPIRSMHVRSPRPLFRHQRGSSRLPMPVSRRNFSADPSSAAARRPSCVPRAVLPVGSAVTGMTAVGEHCTRS